MRINLIIPFLLLSLFSKAQSYGCVDSTLIEPPGSFYCPNGGSGNGTPSGYDPVCGCDGHTYRNQCFAMYQGGITPNNGSGFTSGICGVFDIDLTTDVIVPGGPNTNIPYLSIYVNSPTTAIIWIFDVYGRTAYEDSWAIPQAPPAYYVDISSYVSGLQPGLYYLFVIIAGQPQYRKFAITAEE